MRPEMPFLAAGAVALAGGVAKNKGIPPDAFGSVFATVALVLVASATDGTRIAPLVRAIGLLTLLAVVMVSSQHFGVGKK